MQSHSSIQKLIEGELVGVFISDSPYLQAIRCVLDKIPRLILLVLLKKVFKGFSSALDNVGSLSSPLLKLVSYSKKTYSSSDPDTVDFHICSAIRSEGQHLEKAFPRMFYLEANSTLTLYYFRPLQYRELQRLEKCGKELFEKFIKKMNGKVSYSKMSSDLKYSACTFSKLYPSSNYLRLSKMIKRHFDISEISGVTNVLSILVNGVPGLGKTKFAACRPSVFQTRRLRSRTRNCKRNLSCRLDRFFEHRFQGTFR